MPRKGRKESTVQQKKNWRKLLAFGLAAVLCTMPTLAHAEELDQLKTQKSQNDALIQQKDTQLKNLNADKAKLDEELESLDQELTQAQDELSRLKDQIRELQVSIEKTKKDIASLDKRIDEKKEVFKERLQVMYKNGKIGSLEVLLSSNGIQDFLSRARTMKALAGYDRNLISDLLKDLQDLETKKKELAGQKASLELAEKKQQESVSELEKKQAEKKNLLLQLGEKLQLTEEDMRRLQEESNLISDKIAEKMQELEEREANLSGNAGSAQSALSESSSGYAWPATDYTITSPFGYRIHPIFGTWRFHRGIDIGADYGTPVFATASGVVTTAEYDSGGGNYIVLDHDDNTGSMYAHLSAFNCYVGQHVKKGQVIGYIGSTGNSTGAHLHFEFYVNGQLVNPLAYL